MILAAAALSLAALGTAPPMERFDHDGSLFAVIAPGAGLSTGTSQVPFNSGRWVALVGGGAALPAGHVEALLQARLAGRAGAVELTALAGLRTTFMLDDRLGTFADVQLAVPIAPTVLFGPRLGAGVQFEVSPVAGVFCEVAALFAMRSDVLFAGDLSCGVQLRTYVL